MKIIVAIISVLFLLYSCKSSVEKKDAILNKVSGKGDSVGNIYTSLNCDDENFDLKKMKLLDTIKSIQKQIIKYASTSKLDSEKINGLINTIKENDSIFDNSFTKEADLIFWSYGNSSMRGERLVSTNCYYLLLLNRRIELLMHIKEKVENSFAP